MSRTDAFRHIDRDETLKEEILSRIDEEPGLGERTSATAPGGSALETPRRTAVDTARRLIEDPPQVPVDPPLEAIILRMGRPVLLVRGDDVSLEDIDTETWRSRLEAARPSLHAAIRSVGRIELSGNPQYDWVGTGWIVADDVIVTNRHVAEVFAHQVGEAFMFRRSVLGQMEARLDFLEEHGHDSAAEFRVVRVLHIEPDPGPDMAFLQIDWATSDPEEEQRRPIPLAHTWEPTGSVAVIGYPAKDTRTRISDAMDRIFGNVYDVKRLAPGEVTSTLENDRIVTHDATTLGGNSGSVVLDLERGRATALHFAGREEVANYAVAGPVVHARLQQVLASAGVHVTPLTVPGESAGPRPEDLLERNGYDSRFLGVTVDHPALAPQLEDALAPVAGRDDGILTYRNYSVRMHRHRRLALYTAVNIDGARARNVRRTRDRWAYDPRVEREFQVGEEIYARNRLDRGHLVRRLDPAWGDTFEEAEAAAMDTFFYTNCSPQHEMLNQRLWLGLEDHILGNADVHDLRVSVFSGPVFRDDDRRYREFLVPEDLWKVVAMVNGETGRLSATGYVLSQRDFMNDLEFTFGQYLTYQVPVVTIEQQTGLDFGDLNEHDPIADQELTAGAPLQDFADIRL